MGAFGLNASIMNSNVAWKIGPQACNLAQLSNLGPTNDRIAAAMQIPLFESQDHTSVSSVVLTHHHIPVRGESRRRYEWGRLHPPGCQRKRSSEKRVFRTNITANSNNSVKNTVLYGSITQNRCSECQVFLCLKSPCWQQHHQAVVGNE
jgi:hypothetical protein